MPTRSSSSNGPMRKPAASFMTRSTSTGSQTPSLTMRSASGPYARPAWLTRKPGVSLHTTACLPMRRPMASSASTTAASVRNPAMTSTSFISGGGLKKCSPAMRSGCAARAATAVTGSDEVFVARMESRGNDAIQLGEGPLLDLDVLDDRLDHEVAVCEPVELVHDQNPVNRRPGFVRAHAPLFRRSIEHAPDEPDGILDLPAVRIGQAYLHAGGGRDLGDSPAHGSGAEDLRPRGRGFADRSLASTLESSEGRYGHARVCSANRSLTAADGRLHHTNVWCSSPQSTQQS